MGVQADRLYVGNTLIWDKDSDGGTPAETTVGLDVAAGVGQLELPGVAVLRVTGDRPVRIRLYATAEGRDMDMDRSIYARYPGGRCLDLEVNAVTPAWTFDVHAFVRGPTVFWTADGPATITLTGRTL